METKVLVVDDDAAVRSSLKRLIDREGYRTILSSTGETGLDVVNKENPEIVYLDLRLPGMDGLKTLKKLKEISPDIIVFLISAYGTFKDVVEAIKEGAFDFIPKPYNNDEIKISLLKAEEALKIKKEVRHLRYKTRQLTEPSRIIAKSLRMRHILEVAKDVAKSVDTPVLIHGETGVGKEVIAQIIHYGSPRRDGPFLILNCGAIPKDLLESELFGHEKGAFTNASSNKQGLFELAEEGTLLLDEIGELSSEGQVKLLRVLENKTFLKVGGTTQKTTNVRILATTNKKLLEEIERGNFREDLYYRLNVINIEVPPLRSRKEDIIPLSKYFIGEYNKKFKKKIKRISPKAKEFLLNQEWRGNVRELKNIIERIFLLTDHEALTIDSLTLNTHKGQNENSFVIDLSENGISLDEINKQLIEKVLKLSSGNQMKAAKILGLSRSTLRYRMKKYQILPATFKHPNLSTSA